MKFSEFLLFCFDRSIISPKITFSMLQELFLDCIDEDQAKKNKELTLNKAQFNFLLV